ncbi:antitoxin [Janthinobacterium sp. ROICE36]|uniref:antitoxin n=1 Tax=Janthinobacterium sp. ROICE36 TaxID=2048670 RepID=UPI000C7EF2E3|nr:antitoxin [Janthinobacterium sp. ROICE36]PLY44079.1 antitoxin [Janthinobacterium sp. ROICE36]
MSLDVGLNSDSINYEVALDIAGERRQFFMEAIRLENAQDLPSPLFVEYCEARLRLIEHFQDDLRPTDLRTIERILDKHTRINWL